MPVANPPITVPVNFIPTFLTNQLVSEIVTEFKPASVAVAVSLNV